MKLEVSLCSKWRLTLFLDENWNLKTNKNRNFGYYQVYNTQKHKLITIKMINLHDLS